MHAPGSLRAPYLWIMVGLVLCFSAVAGVSALVVTYRMERCVGAVMDRPTPVSTWDAVASCQR